MSLCDDISNKAKTLQLDEFEVVLIQKKITTARITDSEISEIKQNYDKSIALRIIHNKKILSARMKNEDPENIFENALQMKAYVTPKKFWRSLPYPTKITKLEKTWDKTLDDISSDKVIDMANAMINSTLHEKIKSVSGSLNIVSEYFQIANSNDLNYSDKATYISGTINADSDNGSNPTSGIGFMSSRTMDSFSTDEIGKSAKEMCMDSINPTKCDSGQYSIILEPYALGELLAFVFSYNFNLKTYYDKRSCFADKLGYEIASKDFSLMDDPHSPDGIGSKPFDDEGTLTSPRYLIESGKFTNVFSDCFNAFKEGVDSSGNASRQGSPMGRDAQPVPIPSTHNLKVIPGKTTKDEVIKDTKNGILVGRLWYTYPVNPERGDFSCTARSGIRIIKDGKITAPSKPVRIIHNLQLLLRNISAICNDSRNVLQWNALPCICPTIRVDAVNITSI